MIAEQPDGLLVEDPLDIAGDQVLREVRRFSPSTLVVAQVADSDRVGPLLDAGAAAVFARQVAASDVAHALLALLTPTPRGPLEVPAG